MVTKQFLIDLGERSVGTFAQAFGDALTVSAVTPAGNMWLNALQVGAVAAGYCVVKGLAGLGIGDPASAAWMPVPAPSSAQVGKMTDQQIEIMLSKRRRATPLRITSQGLK